MSARYDFEPIHPTLPPFADYEITEPETRAPHGFGMVLVAVLAFSFLLGMWAGFGLALVLVG